jgi:hypothetical protein
MSRFCGDKGRDGERGYTLDLYMWGTRDQIDRILDTLEDARGTGEVVIAKASLRMVQQTAGGGL